MYTPKKAFWLLPNIKHMFRFDYLKHLVLAFTLLIFFNFIVIEHV